MGATKLEACILRMSSPPAAARGWAQCACCGAQQQALCPKFWLHPCPPLTTPTSPPLLQCPAKSWLIKPLSPELPDNLYAAQVQKRAALLASQGQAGVQAASQQAAQRAAQQAKQAAAQAAAQRARQRARQQAAAQRARQAAAQQARQAAQQAKRTG
jgi:hypothetical protein